MLEIGIASYLNIGLTTLGSAIFTIGVLLAFKTPIVRFYRRLEARSNLRFNEILALGWRFEHIILALLAFAVIGGLVSWFVFSSLLFAFAPTLVAPILPSFIYWRLYRIRMKRIEGGLPAALMQLASSMQTGSSILQAIEHVARIAPEPLDREFETIARHAREQKSLSTALSLARRRIPTTDFAMVALVLDTALRRGGDIATALQGISTVFKELIRMRRRIETATAQGRMTMTMMTIVPIAIAIIAPLFEPGLVEQVTSSITGYIILGIAFVIYVAAIIYAIILQRVEV